MNLTSVIRPLFMRRIAAVKRHLHDVEQVQRAQLSRMISEARHTLWGEEHSFGSIDSYEDYVRQVPISEYPQLRPLVMRMVNGERDILWPGVTRHFAQSSGTSDGKSKYIPVTDASFARSHYRGGSDVVAHYLNLYPDSRIFDGKSMILGGSFANEVHPKDKRVRIGDLSANLIESINPLANMVRVPSKRIALMADWKEKLPALIRSTMHENVTNISGVPSWFYTVLRGILQETGAERIHDVWPRLEVFFHGGISFTPYRSQYDGIIDPEKMRYLETYNASEGFFAIQDRHEPGAMLLLTDAGTFYEFVDIQIPDAEPIPLWKVEPGKVYSMIITSCNGLWRYPIGDTVRFESVDPPRITIAGRTKHYINAFGEEVMVHNTDAALAKACKACDCAVRNYTVAPVYTSDGHRGHHQWLIEFERRPQDLQSFADALDRALMSENSDYEAKRTGDIFLARLEIVEATEGLFDRWMLKITGKLGGQRKVPRLSNDRNLMDQMLKFNEI